VDFDRALAELDTLVQTLERDGDERALELLQLIDAIHRPALELIARGDLEHPIARALLTMYDLAPVDDRLQVEAALDDVRPYIESHGGAVELLDVDEGVVHLRLTGACVGCAGSAMTLKRGIEEVLRQEYRGFRELVAHEPEEAKPLLQIQKLRRPVFVDAVTTSDLSPGEMKAVSVDGMSILITAVRGELYAFRNGCALDGLPLEGGRLTETVIVCPWHNCAYDARSGKRVDDASEPALAVVPVSIQDGSVRVAVNAA